MRQRSAERREQILTAATELFAADGQDGVTTRAIAERVGVSETILFRHFPSKRELFLAVVRDRGPALLYRPNIAALTALGWPGGLGRLATEYLETTRTHRRWLRILFQEAARDPEVAAELRTQYDAVGQALWAILRAGIRAGTVREEMAPAAARMVRLAVRGFLSRAAGRDLDDAAWPVERDQFVADLVALVAAGAEHGRLGD